MKKNDRHKKIMEIINEKDIDTQDEIAEELKKQGFLITQATISRDIKDLKLIKIPINDNKYKYSLPSNDNKNFSFEKYFEILKNTSISCECVNNFVVIRTLSGSASACAEVIDSLNFKEIIGTIAGDNTIFIMLKDCNDASYIKQKINDIIKE